MEKYTAARIKQKTLTRNPAEPYIIYGQSTGKSGTFQITTGSLDVLAKTYLEERGDVVTTLTFELTDRLLTNTVSRKYTGSLELEALTGSEQNQFIETIFRIEKSQP